MSSPAKLTQRATLLLIALSALFAPTRAAAFCGFYVAGADSSLYANATMVVLMRVGTQTVLSMQNNYQGPPDAFALVIPVPTVLTQDQVKILPKDVFTHVDALGAPRLVEYWETDPCRPPFQGFANAGAASAPVSASAASPSVTVEATFTVGEYDVVILGANDSSALETWLHDNQYNVPNGASTVLQPYVAAGTKFFVAKVDPTRVTFVNGQAALSPLRFNYESQDFSLPVRLGLLNSQGTQDLIVNILASSRYEVANHPNVTIPTNIRVQNDVRNGLGSFYESLFSKLTQSQPTAVVTEYAWSSGSCDPCPTPPLSPGDLATLGADVTQSDGSGPSNGYVNFTLTRLHYRYTKDTLGDDLVFQAADPITGGRGIPDAKGELTQDVTNSSGTNNFQGRYVILHAWTDALSCQTPTRGSWGEQGMASNVMNTALSGTPPTAADLSSLVAESVPSIGIVASSPIDPLAALPGAAVAGSGGSAAGASASGNGGAGAVGGSHAASSSAGKTGGGSGSAAGSTTPKSSTPATSHGGCSLIAAAPQSGAPAAISFGCLASLLIRRRRARQA
jgi:hypothetical protein